MQCDCIRQLEELAQLDDEAAIVQRTLHGVLHLYDPMIRQVVTRTYSPLVIERGGQQPPQTLSVLHSHCPYCGAAEVPLAPWGEDNTCPGGRPPSEVGNV